MQKKTLPQNPGVYLFLNHKKIPIYIGKAKNLSKRTAYYFKPEGLPKRLKRMVNQAVDLQYHITETEQDALLLEAQMIKEHRPIYNILYREGRAMNYISFSEHDFPRLEIAKDWKSGSFGPYLSQAPIKLIWNDILKTFKLRTCSDYFFETRKRPCLEYHSARCSAPCVGFIDKDKYSQKLEDLRKFFSGKTNDLVKEWQKALQKYAKNEQFEKASEVRDQIVALAKLRSTQNICFPGSGDLDLIFKNGKNFYIEQIRGDIITKIEYRKYEKNMDTYEFLWEYYENSPANKVIGPPINLPFKNYFSKTSSLEKKIQKAAKERMQNLIKEESISSEWANYLGLEKLETIEVYDCAHYAGKNALCGSVFAKLEGFEKSKYRIWKSQNSRDDLFILGQALAKRAKNKEWPDMILIDGGKTQLNVALNALHPFDKVFAFAKGENRKGGKLYSSIGEMEIYDENLFLWLIKLRDEAHRWANKNCRKGFSKIRIGLEKIEGLGKKTAYKLLQKFGSEKGVLEASFEDLVTTDGIGHSLAQKIKKYKPS